MPWYRINGMAVHLKGSKLPPACRAFVVTEDGVTLQRCADLAPYLCDGPGISPASTCDAPMCSLHAWEVDTDKHLCPQHLEMHVHTQTQRGFFTDLAVEA